MALIVYPPTHDWHRMVQRPHHLLWEAARAGHVVIFCNATQRADRAMDRMAERFYVCHNFQALQQSELPAPILYVTRPEHLELAPRLRASRTILDVTDNLPGDQERWPAACAAATEVWCASRRLQGRLSGLRADVRLVPNAADAPHWSQTGGGEPISTAVLPRPIVGYIGAVGDWVDVPSLCAASRALPEVHFLVVGPVQTMDWTQADGVNNLHCVGEHLYPQLPAFAGACDALVIPYRPALPTAEDADPVKLWNLLATGKPLVCSGLPAADELGDLVCRVAGAELARGVGQTLTARTAGGDERRAVAACRTWTESWRLASVASEWGVSA